MPESAELMEAVVNLCKRRGLVFPSSEIYGGFRSTYDYGPLGVLLKRNVMDAWWRSMVQLRDDIVGLDASILMAPKVWEASGHLATFTDPLVDCKKCKERWREDQIEGTCPNCGSTDLTEARPFNLMFKTFVGPVEDEGSVAYLRPETAQGIFVNFMNVLQTSRKKPPFGIAQMGKSFRNEITPGNFIFRTRELEGVANRTDYDLTQHAKFSGEKLEYFDQATGERYVPHVIEPAAGVGRSTMAFLLAAYDEDVVNDEKRTVLRLHPRLAPIKVAVLPLSKKDTLTPTAREVLSIVQSHFMSDYDETQSIGRRYRRQDEAGTPYCVTIDFETLDDRAVTVRDRDTLAQDRVSIDKLVDYL